MPSDSTVFVDTNVLLYAQDPRDPAKQSAAAAWLALWGLTPGLLANGVGSLLTDDPSAQVLIESALALAVLLVLSAVFARATREAFAPTRLRWAYALPLVLVAVLPLHYDLDLPVGVYIA